MLQVMKTVDVAGDTVRAVELLKQAGDEDLIVRLPDGSCFLLAAIDESDVEVLSARRNAALMQFLDARAKNPRTIPLQEVKQRLGFAE